MRLLVIAGPHKRHLWFARKLADSFDLAGCIIMAREDSVPLPPESTSRRDSQNFATHFRLRQEAEDCAFSIGAESRQSFAFEIQREDLNGPAVIEYARQTRAEACIVFGADILGAELLAVLPPFTLNVHLGVSPWYRGAATLFWPFYNLEPHWAGATLHYLTPRVDAGPIVVTCHPVLERGDGIHDVGVKVVVQALDGVVMCLNAAQKGARLMGEVQPPYGRLYLRRHFRPEHLRVNYDLFNDRMVDAYLDGDIGIHAGPHPIVPPG